MEEFVFASIGSLSNPKSLTHHLEHLEQDALINIAHNIGVRSISVLDGKTPLEKTTLLHILVERMTAKKGQLELINQQPLYPNEVFLFFRTVFIPL